MNANKIVLTPKQEAYLVKHFKNTKNDILMERLGLKYSTFHRIVRQLGLKKTKQFMRKTQSNATALARKANKAMGWPPKGYKIPRSEEFQIKPGERMKDRIGTRRWNSARKRAADTWKKTFDVDRIRYKWGMTQLSNLKVSRQPRQKICDRSYLKRRGYILDEKNLIAYWTPETRRAKRLEAAPRRYYIFKPIDNE